MGNNVILPLCHYMCSVCVCIKSKKNLTMSQSETWFTLQIINFIHWFALLWLDSTGPAQNLPRLRHLPSPPTWTSASQNRTSVWMSSLDKTLVPFVFVLFSVLPVCTCSSVSSCQVSNGGEHPRKQQRSDLNVPLENNNVPEVRYCRMLCRSLSIILILSPCCKVIPTLEGGHCCLCVCIYTICTLS